MKKLEYLKKEICNQIMAYTSNDMYDLLTGDNPFEVRLCAQCRTIFGECPENLEDDCLCRERFKKWCDLDTQNN